MSLIRWTTEASDELEAIVDHILEDNPEAARTTAKTVLDRIAQLEIFPSLGRPGEVPNTRELVVAPYVIVHWLLDSDTVEILHIWHARGIGAGTSLSSTVRNSRERVLLSHPLYY